MNPTAVAVTGTVLIKDDLWGYTCKAYNRPSGNIRIVPEYDIC